MSDKVSIIIAGREIADFSSYRVESDLFAAADAFSFELADPDLEVKTGSRCFLRINGRTELNGIVDRVSRSYEKGRRTLTVEGRDLMGLLVDSYCTTYPDMQDIELKDLAAELLKDIPFIKGVRVIYGKGNKARAVELSREEELEYAQIRPGQTVFDVLKEKALLRGMLFFALPDGTVVFGEPATGGPAEFFLTNTREGLRNNIISASLTDDISRRYSSVTITGQVQGQDDLGPGEHNVEAYLADPAFPFPKPYVATVDLDSQDPQAYARVIMDGQQFDSWLLEVKTHGHTQNGRVYQVNQICHVRDELLGINQDLLCYGRVFEKDKDQGAFTTLRLSRPGVLPA